MIYRPRLSRAPSAWIKSSDYTRGGEVVCGLRYVYRGFTGCPAWAAGQPCTYCYLRTTFRADPELREGVAWIGCDCSWACDCRDCSALPESAPRAAVEKWLGRHRSCGSCGQGECRTRHALLKEAVTCDQWQPCVLNAGELADSLGFSPNENPHVGMLLDLFSSPETNPHGHKILLVSKAGLEAAEPHLWTRAPSENVILSWSAGNCAGQEPYWPATELRLGVAGGMITRGWRVRVRMDPVVPRESPSSFAPGMHGEFVAGGLDRKGQRSFPAPELITLGTLRHRGGRAKLPEQERAEIYASALQGLRAGGYTGPVGLCKETPAMIRAVLGIEPHQMRCNCTP